MRLTEIRPVSRKSVCYEVYAIEGFDCTIGFQRREDREQKT